MRIVFRADASVQIGSGHVMRCLTMAEALYGAGCRVEFICREEPGNCCDLIECRGFPVARLKADAPFDSAKDAEQTLEAMAGRADWLVVDHYRIDASWERRLADVSDGVMGIDDLADRPHHCSLLLDQNLFDNMNRRYDRLVPAGCRLFLGPEYALLRSEFIRERETLIERDGRVRRVLLFFGGSDPTGETAKAVHAIDQQPFRGISFDVVVGAANPLGDEIRERCETLANVSFHRQVTNMAALMANADLAVGAGGSTTWERCFLGLPALVVVVADNQAAPALAADRRGLVRLLGTNREVTADTLTAALNRAIVTPGDLADMSQRCLALMGRRNRTVHDHILAALQEKHNGS